MRKLEPQMEAAINHMLDIAADKYDERIGILQLLTIAQKQIRPEETAEDPDLYRNGLIAAGGCIFAAISAIDNPPDE